jgi:hypothetical protein
MAAFVAALVHHNRPKCASNGGGPEHPAGAMTSEEVLNNDLILIDSRKERKGRKEDQDHKIKGIPSFSAFEIGSARTSSW